MIKEDRLLVLLLCIRTYTPVENRISRKARIFDFYLKRNFQCLGLASKFILNLFIYLFIYLRAKTDNVNTQTKASQQAFGLLASERLNEIQCKKVRKAAQSSQRERASFPSLSVLLWRTLLLTGLSLSQRQPQGGNTYVSS